MDDDGAMRLVRRVRVGKRAPLFRKGNTNRTAGLMADNCVSEAAGNDVEPVTCDVDLAAGDGVDFAAGDVATCGLWTCAATVLVG